MKKLLLLFLFPFTAFGQYTSIPDANFEQALLNYGYDFVIDGFVETSAIDTVTDLYIPNKNIQDLTGIEDFINLKQLFCNDNNLSLLNLISNTELFEVVCANNDLTSLDLRNGNNEDLYAVSTMGNPSLSCIDVDDINLFVLSYWWVDSWTSFSNSCFPTHVNGVFDNKKLIRVIDIHGRAISPKPNIPLIYIYSDGSREKKIFIQ